MRPPIRFVVAPDGVRIATTAHGRGTPIVFVRGWTGSIEALWEDPAFRCYFGGLAERFTVVRYDTRGQGHSDRDPAHTDFESLVSDLEAVVEEHAREPFILYGTTYGGPLAVAYAARHPATVSHLILDGSYARGADIADPRRLDSIVETIREWWPDAFSMLSHFTIPDDVHSASYRQRTIAKATVSAEMAAKLYRIGFDADVSELLPSLVMPVLVMHRRRSRAVPFRLGRELASAVPNATFVSLEGSAHNSWEGDAAAALQAVGEFLGTELTLNDPLGPPSSRREPDGGIVAIMFTDIERSSALISELGDEKSVVLIEAHNELVREALSDHGGSEISTTGDGILAVFGSVTKAVSCAVAIQRAVAERRPGFALRIGLNAGEPLLAGANVHGTAVHAASRITDVARGGEIVVSDVVRSLADGKGFRFTELGSYELRGFPGSQTLFGVSWS